jgi:protein-tyrosine phosphatase
MIARHLAWNGCFNARDLGGLRTLDGREVRRGAAVRSDAVDRLERDGWGALEAHGIRTIIDLRNDDERSADRERRPAGITTLLMPIDHIEDREFWDVWNSGPQCGTPLYYLPHLQRFPERSGSVIRAIAHAGPGGVLFHCRIGRDRTGMVAMLLLSLLGVAHDVIAADYHLSKERLQHQAPEQDAALEAFYTQENTSGSEALTRTLASLDVEGWMRAGGLTQEDLATLRARLLL